MSRAEAEPAMLCRAFSGRGEEGKRGSLASVRSFPIYLHIPSTIYCTSPGPCPLRSSTRSPQHGQRGQVKSLKALQPALRNATQV
ncbi:predicted protein [Plenodomus lingam JN3]|uniref:Predicted protein n=2 Tax=Leptosphaeria maculans TaxID=5022 RepID=E5AFS6_LEPMJ|nr:predicted protein [Plenodomus lingam JN3]CBY02065.1 predicted protein [Plenodomus lingam JN3]